MAGDIRPAHAYTYVLPVTKRGYYYSVNVRGLSQGGDIDCYLLAKNPAGQGYVSKYTDESAANKCSFGFYATGDDVYKLWLFNNGTADDAFDVTVVQ
jgi:hypothetical protein